MTGDGEEETEWWKMKSEIMQGLEGCGRRSGFIQVQ